MAAQRFNFEKSESPASGSPRFAPLQPGTHADLSWIVYVLAGLLLGALFVVLLQKRLKSRSRIKRKIATWDRLHALCAQQELTEEEERVLFAVLRALGVSNPDNAGRSQHYFDSLVAPELVRRAGKRCAESIRRKLFFDGTPEPETPKVGGTHELASGQKIRLHLATIPGTFACTIISVSESGFIVTLPNTGGRRIRPHKGEAVEGFVELDNTLCSFESQVTETFRGGVFACRIAHTAEIKEMRRRKSVRVNVDRRVVFGHFPANQVVDGEVSLDALQNQLGERWEGIVRDLSVGGCALSTSSRRDFEAGDFVQFSLQPLDDDPDHMFFGTIVHVAPIPATEGGGRILHIQFLGLDEDAEGSLTRAVHRLRPEAEPPAGSASA